MEIPGTEQRKHHTPFVVVGTELRDSTGAVIAIVESPEIAAFLKRAANNFDDLLRAAIACRGEIESNVTLPITRPLLKDLLKLIEKLERE